jgi:NADPH:quinone reductase
MRAVVVREFGSFEAASVEEVDAPAPGPGEVLVEVHAAPVNYVDLIVIRGEYQFKPNLPFIPGKGPAGVVRTAGPAVDGLKPGDRVLAMAEYGGYAELVAVDHRQCYRLPDSLSFVEAASISLAFDTAWFALRDRGRLRPGERVLVLGASGAVGSASVQLAKAMGATVLAAVSSPGKFAAARDAGADAMVDLSQPNLRESLRAQVHAATDGAGADIILDPLGGEIFDATLRALAWRGRLVVIGFAAGGIPSVKTNYLLVKNIEVSGLQISDYRKRRPDQVAQCYSEIFDLYVAGKIRPLPSAAMPLDEFKHALRQLQERKAGRRLILLPRG